MAYLAAVHLQADIDEQYPIPDEYGLPELEEDEKAELFAELQNVISAYEFTLPYKSQENLSLARALQGRCN